MEADKVLRIFKDFLERSWEPAIQLLNDDLLNDWLQSNWELLVESCVCLPGKEFLEIYGEGADCNSPSSRVWLPNVLPTHKITVTPKHDAIDLLNDGNLQSRKLVFEKFVFWNGSRYDVTPPFDFVLLTSDEEEFLVSCDQLVFTIAPIS